MKEMYKAVETKISVLKNKRQIGYYETEFTSSFTDESLLAPFLIQVRKKYDVWIKSLPEAYQEEENIHLIISKSAESEEVAKKEVLAAKAYLHKLINSIGNER
jgi:hypothetical protein